MDGKVVAALAGGASVFVAGKGTRLSDGLLAFSGTSLPTLAERGTSREVGTARLRSDCLTSPCVGAERIDVGLRDPCTGDASGFVWVPGGITNPVIATNTVHTPPKVKRKILDLTCGRALIRINHRSTQEPAATAIDIGSPRIETTKGTTNTAMIERMFWSDTWRPWIVLKRANHNPVLLISSGSAIIHPFHFCHSVIL